MNKHRILDLNISKDLHWKHTTSAAIKCNCFEPFLSYIKWKATGLILFSWIKESVDFHCTSEKVYSKSMCDYSFRPDRHFVSLDHTYKDTRSFLICHFWLAFLFCHSSFSLMFLPVFKSVLVFLMLEVNEKSTCISDIFRTFKHPSVLSAHKGSVAQRKKITNIYLLLLFCVLWILVDYDILFFFSYFLWLFCMLLILCKKMRIM